jgi:hypothetical protein
MTGMQDNICPASKAAFDTAFACLCTQLCKGDCGSNLCNKMPPSQLCHACAQGAQECGLEAQACQMQ